MAEQRREWAAEPVPIDADLRGGPAETGAIATGAIARAGVQLSPFLLVSFYCFGTEIVLGPSSRPWMTMALREAAALAGDPAMSSTWRI